MSLTISSIALIKEAVSEIQIVEFLQSERSRGSILCQQRIEYISAHSFHCGTIPKVIAVEYDTSISEAFPDRKYFVGLILKQFVEQNQDFDYNMASKFHAIDIAALIFMRFGCDMWTNETLFPLQDEDPSIPSFMINNQKGNIWTPEQYCKFVLQPFYQEELNRIL